MKTATTKNVSWAIAAALAGVLSGAARLPAQEQHPNLERGFEAEKALPGRRHRPGQPVQRQPDGGHPDRRPIQGRRRARLPAAADLQQQGLGLDHDPGRQRPVDVEGDAGPRQQRRPRLAASFRQAAAALRAADQLRRTVDLRRPRRPEHGFYNTLHEGEVATANYFYSRDNTYLRLVKVSENEARVEFPSGVKHTFTRYGNERT